jgi:hypothetical protein
LKVDADRDSVSCARVATWTGALKGPAFFAYADNYLIDVQEG